jgi:chromosome segregation ATPase
MRIRPENFGRRVRCKHCGHNFVAQTLAGALGLPAELGDEAESRTGPERNGEIRKAWNPIELKAGDLDSRVRRSQEARDRGEEYRSRVRALEEQLEAARQKALDDLDERRKAKESKWFKWFRIGQVEDEVRTAGNEAETRKAELLPLREAADSPSDPQAGERIVRERDEIAAERDRLREEVTAVRAEVEARTTEADGRLARMAEERDGARAEGEQFRDETRRLRIQLDARKAADERSVQLAEEAGRIRGEHDGIRDERDRLREEVRTAQAELEAQSAEARRLANLAGEVEAIRAASDRSEAARQVAAAETEKLQGRLDELEKSLAATLAEQEAARHSWEAERRDLRASWEEDRRDLLEKAERRGREEREARRRQDEEGRSSLPGLQAEGGDTSKELEEALRQVDELRAEMDRLQAGNDAEAAAHREANRVLRGEIDRLTAAHALARQEALDAVRRGEGLEARLGTLGEEVDRIRREREAEDREHASSRAALMGELEAAREEQKEIGDARRQAETDHDALRGQAERLQVDHDELRRRADTLTAERDRLDGELSEARTQVDATSRERDELATRLVSLQEALDLQRKDRELDALNHAKQLDGLRQEQDAVRLSCQKLEEARRHAEEGRDTIQHEVDRLRDELESAISRQRDAVERAERLEAEIQANRDRILPQPESLHERPALADEPHRSPPVEFASSGQGLEELARRLNLCEEANERLRSLLSVFGAHHHVVGKGAK